MATQRPKDEPIPQPICHLQPHPNGLANQLSIRHFVAHGQKPLVQFAIKPCGILHSHLNCAHNAIPEAGVVDDRLGRDFAHVFAHSFGFLGEVHHKTDGDVPRKTQNGFGYPAKGQETEVVVAFVARVYIEVGIGRVHEVGMAEHDPFGQASGARGVAEEGKVGATADGDFCLVAGWLLGGEFTAELLHLTKRNKPRVIVIPQPALIPINDSFDLGDALFNLEELVALLLVFSEGKDHIAVADDVFNFVGAGIGVQANHRPAHPHCPNVAPQGIAVIVANKADVFAPLQAKLNQTQAKVFDLFVGFLPRKFAPNTQLFLAHGYFRRREIGGAL